MDETNLDWLLMRRDHWREQVATSGADTDAVALFRSLLELHHADRGGDHLREGGLVLEEARARHPRSVQVLEHLTVLYAMTARSDDLAEALDVLRRVDPTSPAVRAAAEMTPEELDQRIQDVDNTIRQLLDDAGSPDPEIAGAAVGELRRWAKSYPMNSGYAVNLGLGLCASGHMEEALTAALAAAKIEDGSFADAYNIGILMSSCGAPEDGRTYLLLASRRAATHDERRIVTDALGQFGRR